MSRSNRHAYERRDVQPASRPPGVHSGLVARSRELAHVEQLLWLARRGKSGALALRGESGVGKSSLIEAVVARANEFRTVQVRGRAQIAATPSTATSASRSTSGAPATATALPPQWPDPLSELANALDVDGAGGGDAPALPRFAADGAPAAAHGVPPPAVVEAAARAMQQLAAASGSPILVTVDDCHLLPAELVVAMAVAVLVPLADEPISLVLAWRDTPHLASFEIDRPDVPVHRLAGLTVSQARELLASRFDQVPNEAVLGELVGRTGGNPLALVEVCGRLTPAQLAGWHPLPDPLPVGGDLAEAFDVVRYLPAATRRGLAVVAAGGASRDLMFAAMKRLGVEPGDLTPALEAGVIYERGPRVDFRHPLVRSVAFHRAPLEVRQAVRGALSDVLAEAHAIEASAYHASVDLVAPDEMASRRLVEAARVALDRGDPAAAARHEELAAMSTAITDAVGQHLADACGHWMAAGERARARQCVEPAMELELRAPVAAELEYQRARLATGRDEPMAADRMVAAAEACMAERPHRALAMLVDAAAWRILANQPDEAEAVAERAVAVAAAVSSHSEVLARTVRAAATLAGGGPIDEVAERSHVSLLIGQTERFPSSPEVALVIGRSLAQQGLRHQAHRWAQWIDGCAEHSGDVSLGVVPPLLEGSLLLSDGHLTGAVDAVLRGASAAERVGSGAVAAWGSQLAVLVHAVAGNYELGFSEASKLFAMTDRAGGLARVRALPGLAMLELQRGRSGPAVAWARAVEHDLVAPAGRRAGPAGRGAPDGDRAKGALAAELAASVGALLYLARSHSQLGEWAKISGDAMEAAFSRAGTPARSTWLRGLLEPDGTRAAEMLAAASHAYRDLPLERALVDICRAVRLGESGAATDAVALLEDLERVLGDMGAAGMAALAARERRLLPVHPADSLRTAAAPEVPAPQPLSSAAAPVADWEVTLLGGFGIRHRGKEVALPASLATQAVKIVALQPRITVDELIEYLWEDAEPGVGARRLRNVLWRIRSACGELLVREGNFLRLAPGATTDVAQFRDLADQAVVGPESGTPRAVELARAALDCYRGELLPGDRYADWAAAARESVARTHLRLLDLLVDDAVAGDRQAEALVLLDRLAEVDPFDERHHLRTAEIHLRAGNRGRALDALERAERMLAELNVAPSPAVRELRECLDRS
jgi:DNA-binding SARP family transcriptional activator